MGSLRKHNQIVESLVDRLRGKPFLQVVRNLEYCVECGGRQIEGEVDILVQAHSGVYRFYEIKSGKNRYVKAQKQFDRYKRTHPDVVTKGIYVGMDGVKRLR